MGWFEAPAWQERLMRWLAGQVAERLTSELRMIRAWLETIQKGIQTMAKAVDELRGAVQELKTSIGVHQETVTAEIAQINAKIDRLQQAVAGGTATDAELMELATALRESTAKIGQSTKEVAAIVPDAETGGAGAGGTEGGTGSGTGSGGGTTGGTTE